MLTQWLQPIPERNYLRVVYVGKIRIVSKFGTKLEGKDATLEEVIDDIWEKASVFNRQSFISGHLSCASTHHVVQLLEGEKKTYFLYWIELAEILESIYRRCSKILNYL